MEQETARERVLDAAEGLFYGRGIQTVGMDAVRTSSGVSLKRLYQLFPSKEDLVEAYLRRRDGAWLHRLAAHVEAVPAPRERVLAVFDWLHDWFAEDGYRGCAFVNSFGELGATSPAVARAARDHKEAFLQYLEDLVTAAGLPRRLGAAVGLLAEGAITTSAISGSPEPALRAREAAATLMAAAAPRVTGAA
ncbi:TetR/AcrR family transcriptional regulator [Streptomyces sp. NPDC026673]|uniref:TetR/AcrR family transcriptional regulator n=1 Tax=Streptomyces sp. NPDC026673 TaxID=3155724 RepID=UPI0033FB76BB